MTNAADESISSKNTWNIVNQLSKHDFSCGQVVNYCKDKETFFDQINRNRFDPSLNAFKGILQIIFSSIMTCL